MILDEIDFKILKILKNKAKLPIKDISQKIGLSTTPVFERIKRMEQFKIIKGYTVVLDRNKVGRSLRVLCQISLKEHSKEAIELFETEVMKLEDVNECLHIAGNYDYLLAIEMKDVNAYERFLKEKLSVLSNISNVNSSFVLASVVDNGLVI